MFFGWIIYQTSYNSTWTCYKIISADIGVTIGHRNGNIKPKDFRLPNHKLQKYIN